MGKQITVRKVLQILKKEGFVKSPNHKGGGSHQRYIHEKDPTRYADISFHNSGQVIPIGTLKNIEKTTGVKF
ncbi:type II toxin-antitoxin system HicA family toxin [Bacillus chungangensis]|uniref:RNA binding protein YcfA (HicA-like mRNA interferase family) n=1 Tax=Bacillus chungangensis TaxID=587633 RepID=A0ABT9WM85_9BACI|nr:type II toxin-antitoxin system HicA family toxin [Bacillus chungangensis]MDQ0174397.1 putative RNA binding protein YcfA (HicA-like mRNA interferase family) [Bacillus chungangensis]